MILEVEEVAAAVDEEEDEEGGGVVEVAFAMKVPLMKLSKLVWSLMTVNLSFWYDRVCRIRFRTSMLVFT